MKSDATKALIVCAMFFSNPLWAGDDPWPVQPFVASSEEVFAAADATGIDPGDSEVIVLFEEVAYRIDTEGRRARTRTIVYRVLTKAGVDGWDTISTPWEPWVEERPVFEARVLVPGGKVAMLDPETVSEAPGETSADDVFDDRRVLEAPLPLAQVGCIVERRVTVREKEPRFPGGTGGRFYPTWKVPAYHTRLVVALDASLELNWKAYLLDDVEPGVEVRDGIKTYEFDFLRPEEAPEPEEGLPYEVPSYPRISFTTGTDWPVLAAAYAEVVDDQIAAADDSVFPAEAVSTPEDRLDRVQAALDWVHASVRYTGLEFGRSSIVPYPPDKTISRGFGDCKDQATLMVAVLRRWGIDADVALLASGFDFDTDPDLPSLSTFDHAIVFVPGDPPLWVDPTSEHHRAGSIPTADSGRLALVASDETTSLRQIPHASSQGSRAEEERVFHLADQGEARLVVTVRPSGAFEARYRRWKLSYNVEDLREFFEGWLKTQFLADELDELEFSDPTDMREDFTVRLTAAGARRGFTALDDAIVAIRYDELVDDFPDALSEESDEERQHDYLYPRPFQTVWHYRAVPPAGFVASDLPENRATELGPARLDEVFSVAEDGSIEAVITLDSGPRRITAEEFEATRDALAALAKRDYTALYFVHRGQYLLGQGKTAEGLAELARLVDAEPDVALHQVRLARGLVAAGLGEEARHAAHRAVEIDNTSLAAHTTLGWVLQHDLVGRLFAPGFDLADSLAAFRTATELEDADLNAAVNLAIILEYDATGRRYSPEADLDGAVSQYRRAKETYPDTFNYDHNLLVAMFWNRQFDEILELYPELEKTSNIDALILTAVAAVKGIEEAHRRARVAYRDSDKVRRMLVEVGQLLGQQRFYPEAAAAFKLAAQGAENATELLSRSFVMARTQKIEDLEFDPRSVDGVIKQMYVYGGDSDGDERIRDELLHSMARKTYDEEDIVTAGLNIGETSELVSRQLGLPAKVLIDIGLGTVDWIIEGSKSDVRKVHLRNMADSAFDVVMFVDKEDGAYKLVASMEEVGILGVVALDLLAEGNEAGAREVLDWARDFVSTFESGDALDGDPFANIWQVKVAADAQTIKKAGLALAAGGAFAEQVAEELAAAVADNPDDPWHDELVKALIENCGAVEDFERMEELAVKLERKYPESWYPFITRIAALTELGQLDEAAAVAEARLERMPGDIMAMRMLSNVVQTQGDIDRALDLLGKVVASSEAVSSDFNNRAWLYLFRDSVDDRALLLANAAVQRNSGNGGDYASLHTLATIYAEMDMPAEAYQVIVQAMEKTSEPKPTDWMVFGRMAETYGFEDAARAAYQRVIDGQEDDNPVSTAELARRRLAKMDG